MEYWLPPRMSDRQFSPWDLKRKEFDMNWNIVQDSWKLLKNKVIAHWDKLDNINTVTPEREEVAGEIEQTNGVTQDKKKESIEREKDIH